MRAKLNSAGQITLPKEVLGRMPRTDTFEIELKEGAILLRPVAEQGSALERIRNKMRDLGRSEMIVQEAVTWARAS
jgi:bifunctional DNA-binding transcriptional regulator/antitoxin component of YhaV-PrlF toxin-antitoxin module